MDFEFLTLLIDIKKIQNNLIQSSIYERYLKYLNFPAEVAMGKKKLLWCCVHCTADGKERKQNKYVPAAQNV
jgi:hypothetical protein